MAKTMMGSFANGYAWFVIHDTGHVVQTGYHEDKEQAQQDAEGARWFWSITDYELV